MTEREKEKRTNSVLKRPVSSEKNPSWSDHDAIWAWVPIASLNASGVSIEDTTCSLVTESIFITMALNTQLIRLKRSHPYGVDDF